MFIAGRAIRRALLCCLCLAGGCGRAAPVATPAPAPVVAKSWLDGLLEAGDRAIYDSDTGWLLVGGNTGDTVKEVTAFDVCLMHGGRATEERIPIAQITALRLRPGEEIAALTAPVPVEGRLAVLAAEDRVWLRSEYLIVRCTSDYLAIEAVKPPHTQLVIPAASIGTIETAADGGWRLSVVWDAQ